MCRRLFSDIEWHRAEIQRPGFIKVEDAKWVRQRIELKNALSYFFPRPYVKYPTCSILFVCVRFAELLFIIRETRQYGLFSSSNIKRFKSIFTLVILKFRRGLRALAKRHNLPRYTSTYYYFTKIQQSVYSHVVKLCWLPHEIMLIWCIVTHLEMLFSVALSRPDLAVYQEVLWDDHSLLQSSRPQARSGRFLPRYHTLRHLLWNIVKVMCESSPLHIFFQIPRT